jgi:hypothetical protein
MGAKKEGNGKGGIAHLFSSICGTGKRPSPMKETAF